MKAARFYDRGDIRIEDIPEPKVLPGTVGIQVAWCGICGTDLHEFMEGPIFIPPCGHPHPISGESAPVTMGHEFSGVVYAVGEGVDDIQIGQHVVVEPYIIAATSVSMTLLTLLHSKATSTPRSSVIFITSATTSTLDGSST